MMNKIKTVVMALALAVVADVILIAILWALANGSHP